MTIWTFGDSHAVSAFDKLPYINCNNIGPHLAFSIGRDGLKKFNLKKLNVQEGDTVILSFGEIDCRCHIHKYVNNQISYQNIIQNIVDSYFKAIKENVEQFKNLKTFIYNVVPPIEVDEKIWNNPEFPFLGTNEERKKYHVFFNKCLSEACKKYNYTFFNIYDKYLDSNGFLSKSDGDGLIHVVNPKYHHQFMKSQGYNLKNELIPVKKSQKGQIHEELFAGRALKQLIELKEDINTILDIGSGNGLGTTFCCVLGALHRKEANFIKICGLETNNKNLEIAKENWRNRIGKDTVEFYRFHLAKNMMSESEIRAHPKFADNEFLFDLYYEEEVKLFYEVQTIEFKICIDLVIIDGGFFCVFANYIEALKLNPKYFLIIGINRLDTDKVLLHAFMNGFEIIYETKDKNGAVFLQKTLHQKK
jgi:hypothetical protein